MDIDELQNKLDQAKAIEPPKSMRELRERIFQAGVNWREENSYIVNEGKKNQATKTPIPDIFTVARELNKLVTFTFITKSNTLRQ